MAIPVPHTFTAGDNATSTVMQTLTDTGLYLLGSATSTGVKKSLVRLYQTSTTTTLADSTWTSIGFDAEALDYAGEHSLVTNTSRVTFVNAGVVWASGQVTYTSNSTGARRARYTVNGTEVTASAVQVPAATGSLTVLITGIPIPVNAGDFLELQGWQSSTASLATVIGGAGGVGASSLNLYWISN